MMPVTDTVSCAASDTIPGFANSYCASAGPKIAPNGITTKLKPINDTKAKLLTLIKMQTKGTTRPTHKNSNILGCQPVVILDTMYVSTNPHDNTHPITR